MRYCFEDLKEIIFGIKTTAKDKKAIVRIIEAKCAETSRAEFEFRQAYYSRISGRIETTPWELVKFRQVPVATSPDGLGSITEDQK
jgi:hypothetical protein